jgi:penicillin-binding protein activator
MRTPLAASLVLGNVFALALAWAQPKDPPDLIPPAIDPTVEPRPPPPRPPPTAQGKASAKVAPRPQPKLAPKRPASRPASQPVIVGPMWTDVDTQQAAAQLVADLLRSPQLKRFKTRRRRPPVVKLEGTRNRSSSHLNTRAIDEALHKLLARSPALKVAGDSGKFDLLLTSNLLGTRDARQDTWVESYHLYQSLVDVQTAEKLWIDEYVTHKLVEMVPGRAVKITRLKPDAVVDISGDFNEADAALVVAEATKQLLASALSRARPSRVVRLAPLRNRTSEHIQTKLISARLEQELLRSGKFRVVGALDDLADVRAGGATPASGGRELACSCLISGWITLLSSGDLRQYVVSLEALDPDQGTKLWMMSKSIKKVVKAAGQPPTW